MKPKTKSILLLLVAVIFGLSACSSTDAAQASHSHEEGDETHIHEGEGTVIEADYAFSPSDQKATLDFADEVLVVEIESRGDSYEAENVPMTDFDATVLGSLTERVTVGSEITVTQEGGVIDGELLIFENQPPIEPGTIYVIAGRTGEGPTIQALPGVGTTIVGNVADGTESLAEWALLGEPGQGQFTIPSE